MFKLKPAPTFDMTARIPLPGGGYGEVKVTFAAMGRKAFQEYSEGLKDRADVDGLSQIVVGWEVEDDAGEPVPFSQDALGQFLDAYPLAAQAIYGAYFTGLFREREKNV